MNSQLFFLLNLVLGVIFFLWFLSGRKGGAAKPTQLNLRRDSITNSADRHKPENLAAAEGRPATKQLNVRFMYNGHDWDAYEILGIPAGTRIDLVTEHYQNLIKKTDKDQVPFLEAAYLAILQKA